jgi:hypothetical protein
MTDEFDIHGVKKFFDHVAKDCSWLKFHVVDLDNYEEQCKDEMIHAFLVIPQWCERPRK